MPQERAVWHDLNGIGLVVAHRDALHEDDGRGIEAVFFDGVGRECSCFRNDGSAVVNQEAVRSVKAGKQHSSLIGFNLNFHHASAITVADKQV